MNMNKIKTIGILILLTLMLAVPTASAVTDGLHMAYVRSGPYTVPVGGSFYIDAWIRNYSPYTEYGTLNVCYKISEYPDIKRCFPSQTVKLRAYERLQEVKTYGTWYNLAKPYSTRYYALNYIYTVTLKSSHVETMTAYQRVIMHGCRTIVDC